MKISAIVCDFSCAKGGKKVYSVRYGDGVITNVFKRFFTVDFENFNMSFFFDGKEAGHDKHPSLFWTEPELEKLP